MTFIMWGKINSYVRYRYMIIGVLILLVTYCSYGYQIRQRSFSPYMISSRKTKHQSCIINDQISLNSIKTRSVKHTLPWHLKSSLSAYNMRQSASNSVLSMTENSENSVVSTVTHAENSTRLSKLHALLELTTNSTLAYRYLLGYNDMDNEGVRHPMNVETLRLMIEVINRDKNWDLVDHVLYHLRTNYSVFPTNDTFYQLVKLASLSNNWIDARRFLNRQIKYGGVHNEPSPKAYVRLLRAMSKAEVWKEVVVLYEQLKASDVFEKMANDEKIKYLFEMLLYFTARKSRWREAVFWMNEMKSLSLVPSRDCYRHVINACNKGSKRREAATFLDELQEVHSTDGEDEAD